MTNEETLLVSLKHLRLFMKKQGWTSRRIAEALGVSMSQLSEWTMEPIDREPDIVCTEPPKAGDPQIIDGMAQHTGGGTVPKRADGWTECIHCGHRHAPNGQCDPLETWPCPTSKVIREVKL